jgi:hypothetical protein
VPLVDARLTELQRAPGFVFVREHGVDRVDAPGLIEAERADGGPAVLVRPDGYIAWAGASTDRAGRTAALTRWTGPLPPIAEPQTAPTVRFDTRHAATSG